MKYFLIGDIHKGHEKIKEYCGRPDDFESLVARNWRMVVKPEDTVIDLGDTAFDTDNLGKFLNSLPGTKIKVMGNHDRQSRGWYSRNGFTFCCDSFSLYEFIFTHTPMARELVPVGHFNVHAHTHQAFRGMHDGPYWAYSLENHGYTPVPLDLARSECIAYTRSLVRSPRLPDKN